jgi:hypothetical protein
MATVNERIDRHETALHAAQMERERSRKRFPKHALKSWSTEYIKLLVWQNKGAVRNKLSRSIRIKCNKFIDELLDVCLTCRTHYSRCGAPLHSVGGPAPLLIISVGWRERLVSSISTQRSGV